MIGKPGTSSYNYARRGDVVSFMNANGSVYHTMVVSGYDEIILNIINRKRWVLYGLC